MATGTARRLLWGQAWGQRGVRGGLVSRGCRSGQQPQDPQGWVSPGKGLLDFQLKAVGSITMVTSVVYLLTAPPLVVCVQSSAFKPAADSTRDWIGPPNRLSNIRPITYHVPAEETALEERLRRLRQQTEIWNHEFWAQQNVTFSKEKDEYISSQLKARGLALRDEKGRRYTLTSEDMAAFYKSFLDTNRTRHANYNKEWYRRNFTITLLMGRVALTNAWKSITDRLRKSRRSPI